jgi:hypothetical protein
MHFSQLLFEFFDLRLAHLAWQLACFRPCLPPFAWRSKVLGKERKASDKSRGLCERSARHNFLCQGRRRPARVDSVEGLPKYTSRVFGGIQSGIGVLRVGRNLLFKLLLPDA